LRKTELKKRGGGAKGSHSSGDKERNKEDRLTKQATKKETKKISLTKQVALAMTQLLGNTSSLPSKGET